MAGDTREDQGERAQRLRSYLTADTPAASNTLRWLNPLRDAMPGAVPALRTLATTAMLPVSRQKLRRLRGQTGLRVHLGCGFDYKSGWVNLDLFPVRADAHWDLRRGIPLDDGSAAAVFHEHMLEHIPVRAGLRVMQETLRVLEPGGVLRVGVPDAGLLLDSYAGRVADTWADTLPTRMLSVQQLFYENGHQAMYDEDTLRLLCLSAGFAQAERRAPGEGRLGFADLPTRAAGTLYVEAVKGPA